MDPAEHKLINRASGSKVEQRSAEVTRQRDFNQMNQPKINIERYIHIFMLVHLPLYFLFNLGLQEYLIEESKKFQFEENMDKVPNPYQQKLLTINFMRVFITNMCDVLVILYLFKPMAKPSKEVIIMILDYILAPQEAPEISQR